VTPDSKQKLRHFEMVDCAVRSAEHFYLMASHVYQLDDDVDDPDAEPAAAPDPETDLREAIRIAVYFPNRPDDKKWAFRTVRNIEFMKCAVVDLPSPQLIGVSLDGQVYALGSGVSELEARIEENKLGPLRGSVRQVLAIDGVVHAVQGNRGLCRRVGPGRWESLCADLPVSKSWKKRDSLGFTYAAATSAGNIYCAGGDGDLWHFDGKRWTELHFPSNVIIETICCAVADDVYIGCQNGIVYRGSGNTWKKIDEGEKTLSYRSMVSYQGKIWCSSDFGIWTIDGDRVVEADLPANISVKAGVLSAKDDILLAAGSNGAAYFDGKRWTEFLNFL
jgi:hypothetical protein